MEIIIGLIGLAIVVYVITRIKNRGRAKKRIEEGQAKIDKLRGK